MEYEVAYNDVEKTWNLNEGLKPSIRNMLGAFSIHDFRSTMKKALWVEMKETYTDEIRMSSGIDYIYREQGEI